MNKDYKYLYIVKLAGMQNAYKIGVSNNYKRRFDFLEMAGVPIEYYRVWKTPKAYKLEQRILAMGIRMNLGFKFAGLSEIRVLTIKMKLQIDDLLYAEVGEPFKTYITTLVELD